MATIVQHRQSGERWVLIGTGFGMFETARPHWVWGDASPVKEGGQVAMVAVANSDGIVGWFPSEQLQVIEVDGKPPRQWIEGSPYR